MNNLYNEMMAVDFDRAFNGASIERTYSNDHKRLIVGKRKHSPTGKKYVITNYSLNGGKFCFYWSTYDIETLNEAYEIAVNML
jgi:hypothetical protein